MKKNIICLLVISAGYCATSVYAASATSGEIWEIVTKTDVAGMPNAMPEMTSSVCLQKGAEKDPKMLVQQDSTCEITDVKSSKGKTSWKMKCNRDGDEMAGSGEVKYKVGGFDGITKLSGKSNGEVINLTATFKGKKTGTACDPSAPVNTSKGMEDLNEMMGMAKSQMASAMNEQCEVANFHATDLISSKFFGPNAACAGKEKFACKVINKEVVRDVAAYVKLAKHDDTSELSIAGVCGINMSAVTGKICATVDESNYRELADYCPAEAKEFQSARSKSGTPGSSSSSGDGNAFSTTIDNARKLKGLFGF